MSDFRYVDSIIEFQDYVYLFVYVSDVDFDPEEQGSEYRLIGVTVHVGSAEGGHYYNLIKDTQTNKW